MIDNGTDILLTYLADAVRYDVEAAPFELCHDSQTQWIISKLRSLNLEKIELLDYGCGHLRLLNAVHEAGLLSRIHYVATDISTPEMTSSEALPFMFKSPHDVRAMLPQTCDVAIIMNVIHEISINDFADIVETVRRLLKPTGHLLLVDMAILPKGEYRALPYYPWELESIFFKSHDFSYASKSGVPVVALEIPASAIPIHHQFERRLFQLIVEKRDVYSELACSLTARESNPNVTKWLCRFSLNRGDAHDLGYLMLMSGFANFKLIQHQAIPHLSYDQISDAAEAILQWFFSYWAENNELPVYFSVLNDLGGKHTYAALSAAMSYMSEQTGAFFLPMIDENLGLSELTPSESLDVFEDRYDYDAIRKLGLGTLQAECHRAMWPDG